MSDERIQHPRDVVAEGDTIHARIIRIDPARKRIGLSLRHSSGEGAANDGPDDALADSANPDSSQESAEE
jgi:small subunit ribosomal protein S1